MALSWNSGSTTQSGGNPTKASQIGWIRGTNFKKESIKMKVKDWRRSSNIHCADREWLSHHHHPPLSASRIFMFRYWPETKVGSRVQDYVQWTTAALLSLISHTPPFHGMCRHTGCPRRVQRALLKELCWVHSGRSALGEFVWWLLDTVGSKHFFTLRAAIIPSLGRQLTMLGRAGSPASFTWPAGESTDSQSTHRALLVRGRVFQGTEARSVDYHCFNCNKSSDVSRV